MLLGPVGNRLAFMIYTLPIRFIVALACSCPANAIERENKVDCCNHLVDEG